MRTAIARVNDSLRDVFDSFSLEPPPHALGDEGVFVIPILRKHGFKPEELNQWLDRVGDLGRCISEDVDELEPIRPPLRKLHAPSPQLADSQAFAPNRSGLALPPLVVGISGGQALRNAR